MRNGTEGFPEDFDVARLMPPSDETRRQFESVFSDLESLATIAHSRTIEVEFGDQEDAHIQVYCATQEVKFGTKPDNQPENSSALWVNAVRGESSFTLGQGNLILGESENEILESIVEDLADGLEETSAEWLRKACKGARVTNDALIPKIVEELQSASPVHVNDHTTYKLMRSLNNGSRLIAFWLTADDKFLETYPDDEELRFLHLRTSGGITYEYSIFDNGTEKLFVKKPGERVPRKIQSSAVDDFLANEATALGITDRGEELMRDILAAADERTEATTHGLDKPTDGNMIEFTKALQASIKSGAAPNPG